MWIPRNIWKYSGMAHQQFVGLKDPNVQVMKSVLRSFKTSKNALTFSIN